MMSNNIDDLYQLYLQSSGVTIDNRTISGGEIFFGLPGEKVNGGKFSQEAIDKGALCCVVNDAQFVVNDKCMLVEDVLLCLQQLAAKHRNSFDFPVLALTGSNGKTTTKELIAAVLSKKFNVTATKGNLNNHIGVPLTLLSIPRDCNFAVIEMGANHQHEIEGYCIYADPDFALITNIGKAHLEGFGGEEGVLKGKSELFNYVKGKQGVLFIHSGENKLIHLFGDYHKTVRYGFDVNDYATGRIIKGDEFATVEIDEEVIIHSHLVGDYNANNIIAAACIGKYFDISFQDIQDAIENYYPDNNRSELKEMGGNYFIMDAYNANPSSMKAALENFSALKATNKLAIIGDMLELGEYAAAEHQAILNLAASGAIHQLVTVGPLFAAQKGEHGIAFQTAAEAKAWFQQQQFQGYTILLKGSRGMKLETIIQ
jgi:UDP-N-acetylmuramoyl-tripeptide--D-alanyl-D-alanine ligase